MNAVLKIAPESESFSDAHLKAVHRRLVKWGREKFYPGWEEPSPSAVLGRLMDEGRDERRRRYRSLLERRRRTPRTIPCKETHGVRMDLFVHGGMTMMCAPDGGAMALMIRMKYAIDRSTECRVVGELLVHLQDHDQNLWHIIRVTYRDAMMPVEIPRPGAGAAELLGIAESTYWERRKKALTWMAERLALTALPECV